MTAAEHEAIAKTNAAVVGFEDNVTITGDLLKQLREANITGWDFRSYAEQLLIIQGKADEIVSFAEVSKFAAANHIPFIQVEKLRPPFSEPGAERQSNRRRGRIFAAALLRITKNLLHHDKRRRVPSGFASFLAIGKISAIDAPSAVHNI